MKSTRFPKTRAVARVDLGALRRNYRLLERLAGGAEVMAVVKANAYGHGLSSILPTLLAAGCRRFAVATLEEGVALRSLCEGCEILILGYTPPTEAAALVRHRLTQTVFSAPYAVALSECLGGERLPVHLKIDGGMCRLGFPADDPAALTAVLRQRSLSVVGIYTHFPSPDTDPLATRAAFAAFLACRALLEADGRRLLAHAAASPTLALFPEFALDAVRVGLSLYGISPTGQDLGLSPVLSLHAPIVQIHEAPIGRPVGYGGDFVTARPSRIGTLPIGYADGFPRAMRGFPLTLCHGAATYTVRTAGRICMDQMMLDLTDTPAQVGDEVCLWNSAVAPARHLGTIPYEVLSALSPRVTRLTTSEKEKP